MRKTSNVLRMVFPVPHTPFGLVKIILPPAGTDPMHGTYFQASFVGEGFFIPFFRLSLSVLHFFSRSFCLLLFLISNLKDNQESSSHQQPFITFPQHSSLKTRNFHKQSLQ